MDQALVNWLLAGFGVTINTKNGLKISGPGGRVTLFKRVANQWWLTGDTSA